MFIATKTVQGLYPIMKGKAGDKGVHDGKRVTFNMKESLEAENVEIDMIQGARFKGDEFLPCIKMHLMDRGLLVEASELPMSNDNITDLAASGETEVTVGRSYGDNRKTDLESISEPA